MGRVKEYFFDKICADQQAAQKYCGCCNTAIPDNVTPFWDEGTPFCSQSCLEWTLRYKHHNIPPQRVNEPQDVYATMGRIFKPETQSNPKKKCKNCNNEFTPIHAGDNFCSTACKKIYMSEEAGEAMWESTRE
ncbi:MAG TPA: hypothetical protein PLJ00_15755 [Chitinophagales bacterium]|nr:hypothetical protein [Chitinophagales bacterium]